MRLLPDIPRFYTALAEWAACMVFIIVISPKIKGWKFVGISGGILMLQSFFLILTGNIALWLWLPCMIIAVFIMIGFIYVCVIISWRGAVYFGLFAFVIAEFAASIEWQTYCFFEEGNRSFALKIMFLVVIYAVIYIIAWKLIAYQKKPAVMVMVNRKELMSACMIAVSVFAISNLNFLPVTTPFTSLYGDGIATIRTMVDFAGVAMMFAHYVQCCEIRTNHELEAMQNVLRNQYLQYRQSRESIELINYKYHDLKHQIAILRTETDAEKRNEYLNKMEEEIYSYEAQNKTGNKVVDTILTSKSMTCKQFGISMNCVADGTLLNFMDTMDICSILGNSLDNAIECEKKIEDQEKRLIKMAIYSQKKFVIMKFENYFDGELEMNEGIPITTKTRKKEFHGYGIKSIKYTVKKYDGVVKIEKKNQWFELMILIPVK